MSKIATGVTPILGVDVDGVLNALSPGRPASGWLDAEVRLEQASLRIRHNPGHGAQLLALAAEHGAELLWCTSWQELANEHIGPLVGLPELPWVPMDPGRRSESLGSVKARSIAACAGDRPFCWLDDERDAREALACHPVPHKVVWVEPLAGLQDHHLRRAGEWLASLKDGGES
jgi:hypothetical protein